MPAPQDRPDRDRLLAAEERSGQGDETARRTTLLAHWLLGKALLRRGLLQQEGGDLEHAAGDLKRALHFFDGCGDPGLAPSLTARVLLALAEVEAALGEGGGPGGGGGAGARGSTCGGRGGSTG